MSRGNGSTRKTTVYLDPESTDRLRAIQDVYRIRTRNKAIRKAIALATTPAPRDFDLQILCDVVRWAERRPFQTPAEQRSLREIVHAVYDLLANDAAASRLESKTEQLSEARERVAAATKETKVKGDRESQEFEL